MCVFIVCVFVLFDQVMTSLNSCMKEDLTILPSQLLDVKPPLPFEIYGLGQAFRKYDTWAFAKCTDDRLPTLQGAGHRLYATESCLIPAQDSLVLNTGLSVVLPPGHYGKIEGCLSLGMSHSVIAFGAIIAENNHSEIMVKLFNHGSTSYLVNRDDYIAQLIVHKYVSPSFQRVVDFRSGPADHGRKV